MTLVGREPSGVGGAQRRGGGKPAYRKGLGGSPAHTGDPPLLLCYQVLPRGIVMKVIIMINIISNITCTLLKYRVVLKITGNVFPHLDIPLPTLQ